MRNEIVTALVVQWDSKDRPFRAEIMVDGYCVEKSFHSTRESAFEWAEKKKAEKRKELSRG